MDELIIPEYFVKGLIIGSSKPVNKGGTTINTLD